MRVMCTFQHSDPSRSPRPNRATTLSKRSQSANSSRVGNGASPRAAEPISSSKTTSAVSQGWSRIQSLLRAVSSAMHTLSSPTVGSWNPESRTICSIASIVISVAALRDNSPKICAA